MNADNWSVQQELLLCYDKFSLSMVHYMQNSSPLEIVEIIRPSIQGRTQPFLCRAEDEELYYVKGRLAGVRGQFCEWVVAHLAEAFGLPVPPFRLVKVPVDLIEESPESHKILGAGIAFASLAKTRAQWFENSFVSEVPRELRCAVLAFDWWVHNSDRIYDNPNLLWSPNDKELVVIDHAFSFDDDFWPTIFLQYHVFKEDWLSIISDSQIKDDLDRKVSAGVAVWQTACDNAPQEWKINPPNGRAEELLDCAAALRTLTRGKGRSLWTAA